MTPLISRAQEHSSASREHGYLPAFRGELSVETPVSSVALRSNGDPSPALLQRVLDGLREL